MTDLLPTPDLPMTDVADDGDREPTPAEIESWEREAVFAAEEQTTAEEFPRLWNVSVGITKRAIVRPVVPQSPEYVTITLLRPGMREDDEALRRSLAIYEWNQLWEAAQFRRRFFDENDLTPDLAKIADRGDFNIILVPRTQSRYYEYAPLYHLLDRSTCERFGLPLPARGQWPFGVENLRWWRRRWTRRYRPGTRPAGAGAGRPGASGAARRPGAGVPARAWTGGSARAGGAGSTR